MGTAIEDGLLAKNPCTIKGAGVEHHPERSVATIEQVFQLAEAIDPRFRMMVVLASFTGLRLGELQALTPRSVDVAAGTLTVTRQLQELGRGGHYDGPPKSDAGYRTVAIPPAVLSLLAQQVEVAAAEARRRSSSVAQAGDRSGAAPSTRPGTSRSRRWACRPASAFTISTAPATPSPRPPAPVPRSSWSGSATARPERPSSISGRERDAAIAAALSEAIVRSVGSISEAS